MLVLIKKRKSHESKTLKLRLLEYDVTNSQFSK